MTLAQRIERHRDVLQLLSLFLLLFVVHTIAFGTVKDMKMSDVLKGAFAFSLPPVAVGWITAIWLLPWLPKSPAWRAGLLVPLAIIGSVIMYSMTKAILGVESGVSPGVRRIGGLPEAAMIWQIIQGMSYFFVAFLFGALCELDTALIAAQSAVEKASAADGDKPNFKQLLVRSEGGIVAVQVDEIIRLEAAGDYSEIITYTKNHLARMSLSDCEEKLGPLSFLRVHRSHMINLKLMVDAESAGNGRLQATMINGDRVVTSRNGAQALRAVAV